MKKKGARKARKVLPPGALANELKKLKRTLPNESMLAFGHDQTPNVLQELWKDLKRCAAVFEGAGFRPSVEPGFGRPIAGRDLTKMHRVLDTYHNELGDFYRSSSKLGVRESIAVDLYSALLLALRILSSDKWKGAPTSDANVLKLGRKLGQQEAIFAQHESGQFEAAARNPRTPRPEPAHWQLIWDVFRGSGMTNNAFATHHGSDTGEGTDWKGKVLRKSGLIHVLKKKALPLPDGAEASAQT